MFALKVACLLLLVSGTLAARGFNRGRGDNRPDTRPPRPGGNRPGPSRRPWGRPRPTQPGTDGETALPCTNPTGSSPVNPTRGDGSGPSVPATDGFGSSVPPTGATSGSVSSVSPSGAAGTDPQTSAAREKRDILDAIRNRFNNKASKTTPKKEEVQGFNLADAVKPKDAGFDIRHARYPEPKRVLLDEMTKLSEVREDLKRLYDQLKAQEGGPL